jgi:IgA Peptidase M64
VKRTYFDATFCGDGRNRRLLVVDDATAEVVATDQVPDWDAVLVIVNSTVYGGSGGKIAVLSLDTEAVNLALHELGHSVFQLADEYDSLPGCGRGGRRRLRRPQVRRAARAQRHRQHRPRHPEVAAAGRPDHAATDQPDRQLPPVQPAGQPTAARHGRALRGGGRLPLRRLPARVRLQAADPARPLLRGVPAPHPAKLTPLLPPVPPVAATAWAPRRLDLFVRGAGRACYHKWLDGSAWGPSLDGAWQRLGGSAEF